MTLNRTPISVGTTSTNLSVAWENEFKNCINQMLTNVAGLTDLAAVALAPQGQISGFIPTYNGGGQVSVAPGIARDSTNTYAIATLTNTIVDLANVGLINGCDQSAVLSGTVSVVINTTTVTGVGTSFTTTFQVGDIIAVTGSSMRRIISITSNTSLTVIDNFTVTISGGTYQRGGRAPDAFYHLYAITNGTTSGFMFSTRSTNNNQVFLDVLSGYSYRQLPLSIRTDSNANIMDFQTTGWPFSPKITFRQYNALTTPFNVLLIQTNSSTFTSIGLSNIVPITSKSVDLFVNGIYTTGSSNTILNLRPTGTTISTGMQAGVAATSVQVSERIPNYPTSSTQSIDWKASNTNATWSIDVVAYNITGVV